MFLLKKILSALVLPPMGPLLLAFAGLWLARRRPRLGRWLILVGLIALLVLSIPWAARQLLRSLEDSPPITPEALARAQAIVVLGAGSYTGAPEYGGDTVGRMGLERLRYAARLARRSGLPVLLSGGAPFGGRPEAESMAQVLTTELGIDPRWIESASRDTGENASFSAALLRPSRVRQIALVTHAWHMPRARALFEQQGLTVLPAPTGFATDPSSAIENWLPGASALGDSRLALHEWLGRLADRLKAAL